MLYPFGIRKKLSEFAALLSVTHSDFNLVTVKNKNYYVYRYEGKLNGIENAVVLLSYLEKAFGNPKALRAFLSTDVSLSIDEILSCYICQWPIEVFFRQCKDKLAHYICVTGTGEFCSFETGYHRICDTIQQEQYRYLFQCARESNDFDSFIVIYNYPTSLSQIHFLFYKIITVYGYHQRPFLNSFIYFP